jgi:predicted DNA-binding protein
MCADVNRSRVERKEVFLNVRFEPSMHRKLIKLARSHERTLAAEIRTAVKRHIEAEEQAA